MTFVLSKILWLFFNPFNLILIFLILGIIFNFLKFLNFSKIFFVTASLIFLIIGFLPSGSYLMYLLEKNYYNSNVLPDDLDGILIISGATAPYLTKEHGQISLNGSSERLFESIQLIKKYPNVKIVFAGGSGSLKNPNLTHAADAKFFFNSFGIDVKDIFFENNSRNTYENILFAKNLCNPKDHEKWIVVTSAFHLTRVINIAEKLDWQLIPYATDFRGLKKFEWNFSFNFIENIYTFQQSSHEWIGLFSYFFMGRSSKIY